MQTDSKKDKSNKKNLPINLFFIVTLAAVNIFFSFIKFINLFQIRFYDFYTAKTINITVLGNTPDWIIWAATLIVLLGTIFLLTTIQKRLPNKLNLLTIPAVIILILAFTNNNEVAAAAAFPLGLAIVGAAGYFKFGGDYTRKITYIAIMLGAAGIFILISLASLLTWTWNIADYSFPYVNTNHWRWALVDFQLFNVLYPLLPGMFLALLYSWAWIPIINKTLQKIKHQKTPKFTKFAPANLKGKKLIIALTALITVAVFVSYYPLFNKTQSSVIGADSPVYYGWMTTMSQDGPGMALKTDRPLSDLIMYGIQHAFALSDSAIVKLMPILCCVALSVAVFWFVRNGIHNDYVALTAGFFTVFSFQTTVGIYAYSISNWLALIMMFSLFAVFLKNQNKKAWSLTLTATALGAATLLTHPYTWDVMMALLFALLIWEAKNIIRKQTKNKLQTIQLTTIIVVNITIFGIYSLLPFGKGLSTGGAGFAAKSLVLPNITGLQEGLKSSVEMWVGGLYGNSVLLILAILGMVAAVGLAGKFGRLMFLWVMVPSLVLFVVSAENYMFYRIFYELPVQVLAAMGLFGIFNWIETKYELKDSKTFLLLKIAIFALVFLVLLNYALRSGDGAPVHLVG